MDCLPDSKDFGEHQCRENQIRTRFSTDNFVCCLFGITTFVVVVLACVQHTLVSDALHEWDNLVTEVDTLKHKYAYATNRYADVSMELTNAYEHLKRESEMVVKAEEKSVVLSAQVEHWKREAENATGVVVVAERRVKTLSEKLQRVHAEYEEIKVDNDNLNAYLKTFKESTKAKLVEIDNLYIKQQLELRKYKRNYEILVNCLQRKVQQKEQETKNEGK